jgi:hypothetical protein
MCNWNSVRLTRPQMAKMRCVFLDTNKPLYQGHAADPAHKFFILVYTQITKRKTYTNTANYLGCTIIPSKTKLIKLRIKTIWSQRPRGLRLESAVARLLGLRVRIPPGAWLSLVNAVCCHVQVSATGWSLVQGSPTECDVSECDRETPERMSRLTWAVERQKYIYIYKHAHTHTHTHACTHTHTHTLSLACLLPLDGPNSWCCTGK